MNNLGKRWRVFLSVVLDPWTLMLFISVISLFVFSFGQTNATITSLLFVLITAASTILGGRITKHVVDITEGGVLIARGKSAVRSLKLLLRNISALEQRVSSFADRSDEIENHPEVTKRNYEEIQEICNLLEEETVNSIENWTDIVPEADIKTQIGVISELKHSLQGKEEELIELNNELKDTKGKSKDDRKKLENDVKDKEIQISKLEREILERKIGLGAIGDRVGIGGLGGLGGFLKNSSDTLVLHDTDTMRTGLDSITDVTGGTNVGKGLLNIPKDK